MMNRTTLYILLGAALLGGATFGLAQRYGDRRGVPDWETDREFSEDVFTFVRIEYDSYGGGGYGQRGRGYGRRGRGGKWATDYPDSDLNFSYRLQQLTALEVDPDGKILRLTDPELFNYPFIYIVEPGDMSLSEAEVAALRRYLLNGGFLMVDDFWGEREWENFYYEFKRVFPDRSLEELERGHPIFHAVFDLKEKPQIPSIRAALAGRPYGITWEREDAQEVHFWGLEDDKGRLMAIICHNTDLGDGWEEEGVDEWYFHEFSESKAYPMGINIVFHAMTH